MEGVARFAIPRKVLRVEVGFRSLSIRFDSQRDTSTDTTRRGSTPPGAFHSGAKPSHYARPILKPVTRCGIVCVGQGSENTASTGGQPRGFFACSCPRSPPCDRSLRLWTVDKIV